MLPKRLPLTPEIFVGKLFLLTEAFINNVTENSERMKSR